ncbi:NAD(P)/FAD-dependent oxidoreductase [Tamlana sp. 2_MG-2023]|uniref:NAD(P)/FAD-dependent oxidoreductase n=1 Tax=unclassified Tamlana TaxID=2614803 RepID=UPI0026E32924|nr:MULTISPECIES: NAD(P)/FAD-dependent oxidoreductase [unclassified Tamlana]MDO6758642.1 NAD(P)/FAD-dependent oxidoreductase [Tamlana sp. 2_MG-2023]MDO6789341.1 NAD(P)/FAD-dependent oxidoreductase [Tamlana sp. 1_MG-2023]
MEKIIIVGAGFAGLRLAQDLMNNPYYQIYLIDKQNYHQFQPLMYQVASARLEPASISFPLRKVFQKAKNVKIRIAEVKGINFDQKNITTTIGDFDYDHLVMSIGCTTNYFGNQNLKDYAYPMKTIPEAIQLRNRILQTFENALNTTDQDELQALLNFVIVGGGPTGVELAGALAEMKQHILPKDYPDKDFSKLQIYLLEGSPNTLSPMSKGSQKMSQKYLEDLGVVVKTNTFVKDYDSEVVTLNSGEQINSKNVIWAAGVIGNKVDGFKEETIARGNRLIVDEVNEVKGLNQVYALGDIAYMETKDYPHGHPQVASVALQQAALLAKNFKRKTEKKTLKPFKYTEKGSMATIGKRKAVVDMPKFSFQGKMAWFTWMFIHLMLILSIKNKLLIFMNWMISYFNNDSTLRIIMKPVANRVKTKKT